MRAKRYGSWLYRILRARFYNPSCETCMLHAARTRVVTFWVTRIDQSSQKFAKVSHAWLHSLHAICRTCWLLRVLRCIILTRDSSSGLGVGTKSAQERRVDSYRAGNSVLMHTATCGVVVRQWCCPSCSKLSGHFVLPLNLASWRDLPFLPVSPLFQIRVSDCDHVFRERQQSPDLWGRIWIRSERSLGPLPRRSFQQSSWPRLCSFASGS